MDKFTFETQQMNFLNGHLLIAMPNMQDERFIRTVILIFAHSQEGAMGLILNKQTDISFSDILHQLNLMTKEETKHLPFTANAFPVRYGGPVDPGRGFVLHSDDYHCHSTMPITDHIGLTATVDVLKAIGKGQGPKKALVALGYAGWAAGQLEAEILENSWLISRASNHLIFTDTIEKQYDDVLNDMGVNPAFLSEYSGNA